VTADSPSGGDQEGVSPNLWGARFEEAPAGEMWRFTVDHADRRLLAIDVEGSIAHVAMLRKAGLLDEDEHAAIAGGLATVVAEARSGSFVFLDTDEDVHSAVERRLVELVGEAGGKLHTGRSRNDQIALDLRLYIRRSARLRGEEL
jgi:argininosuccinate lyase